MRFRDRSPRGNRVVVGVQWMPEGVRLVLSCRYVSAVDASILRVIKWRPTKPTGETLAAEFRE